MPWVPDSRTAGYLGPSGSPAPAPIEGDAWTDFLHDVIAGVTALDDTLVRPRWQREPPPTPPSLDTNWVAFGVTGTNSDFTPAIIHDPTGDGHDAFQRMEVCTVLCSFYGPNASTFASLLRDGLSIDQNCAQLRSAAVAVVEAQEFTRAADLYRGQYRDRVDINVIFRREIRRDYPVLSLLRAQGKDYAKDRALETDWDTANPI